MSGFDFNGIIPAIAVPFNPDFSIDEPELRRFSQWLASQPGVVALMTNGHTGEVFSLTPRERAEVTRITAKAVDGMCPVISSVVCEGIKDAVHVVAEVPAAAKRKIRHEKCAHKVGYVVIGDSPHLACVPWVDDLSVGNGVAFTV